jgi:hypothetical protein
MPDYMRNSSIQPISDETNDKNFHNDFCAILDEIFSYLESGTEWHKKNAAPLRHGALRGLGAAMQLQADHDSDAWLKLDKVVGDRLDDYKVETNQNFDMEHGEKIMMSAPTPQQLKDLLIKWRERECEYAKLLCKGVRMAAQIDPAIYEALYCLWLDTTEEAMRVKFIIRRLDFAKWQEHDIMGVSECIHKHHASGKTDMDYQLS